MVTPAEGLILLGDSRHSLGDVNRAITVFGGRGHDRTGTDGPSKERHQRIGPPVKMEDPRICRLLRSIYHHYTDDVQGNV